VSRQHSGCAGRSSIEHLGLGRSPASVAAFGRHPAASPCSPRPTASLSTCSTACDRRIPSIVNAWCSSSHQQAMLLHPPGLPKSRSGCRGIRSRLLADLHWSVDPSAEIDVWNGLGAVQLERTTSRGPAGSRMRASAPCPASTKFVSKILSAPNDRQGTNRGYPHPSVFETWLDYIC
jgi:hypothetical protein